MESAEANACNLEALAARIREQVVQLTGAAGIIRSSAFTCALHAVDVGKLLIEAKKQVGHGQFMDWLSHNVPDVPGRTLRRYMAMARKWPNLANSENYHPAIAAFLSAGEKKLSAAQRRRQSLPIDSIKKTAKVGKTFLRSLEAATESGGRPSQEQLAELCHIHEKLGSILATWNGSPADGPSVAVPSAPGRRVRKVAEVIAQ